MSETKKKANRARDARGRFTRNRDFPEPLYDVMCGYIQAALHIYSFARLHTEYTPTIIGQNVCLTSTIAPLRLSPIFGHLACVCTRFRDVLGRFRAKPVEVVVALINYDLLHAVKYVMNYTNNIFMEHMDLQWELMFQEQKIYRIRAYRFEGWVNFLGVSQNCNSKVCRTIRVEEAAIEAMTMDERVSKRDEIWNLLMEDIQKWPTFSPLRAQDGMVLVTLNV